MRSFRTKVEKFLIKRWVPPVMLLAIAILAYGILLPTLGFYWDDMPKLWFLHRLGPEGFHQVYEVDRPFLAWSYLITTPIIGESALGWQLFGLIAHWLSAVGFWWLFKVVWPRHKQEAFWGAALFLVYPAFSQHAISLIYSHYFFIFAAFLVSLGLNLIAIREPKRRIHFTILALVLSGYCMFSVEYFVGLELIRPVLIWWVVGEEAGSRSERLKRTGLIWLPYLILTLVYVFWRAVILAFPTYEPLLLDTTTREPLTNTQALLTTVVQDMILTGITTWQKSIFPQEVRWEGRLSLLLYTGVIVVTGLLFAIYAYFVHDDGSVSGESDPERNRRWPWKVILTGVLGLFAAGWPFWITQLPIELVFPKDRFTLPMAFGSSLLLLGLVCLIPRWRVLRILLIAILVGFGAGMQIHYANQMRVEYKTVKTFLWQLAWRVPGLESGTAVLSNELPFRHYTDNSLSAPLNWLYDPDGTSSDMSYILYYPTIRVGLGIPALEENLPIKQWYRATTFQGSTSDMLAFDYDPPECLHVLDLQLDDSLPGIHPHIVEAVPLSKLDRIITNPDHPATPPTHVFGAEPTRGWCYYYLKADLARQQGDWEKIVELGEIALHMDDLPNNASERIPFIEGYAHLDRWDVAIEQSLKVIESQPAMDGVVCHAWERIADSTEDSPAKGEALAGIRDELGCDTSEE